MFTSRYSFQYTSRYSSLQSYEVAYHERSFQSGIHKETTKQKRFCKKAFTEKYSPRKVSHRDVTVMSPPIFLLKRVTVFVIAILICYFL